MPATRYSRFLWFTLIAITVHGQSAASALERAVFDENTSAEHSVPLPYSALKALSERKEVRQNLRQADESDRKNPAQLFTAYEVHLSAANQTDLVVMGKFPMSGADNTWFWVIRSARKHPVVVLFAGGYSLELLTRRTNGYRDVDCTWSSPQETSTRNYRFDGTRYKLRKEQWQKNQ